jgi:hypothetical protein
MKKIYKLFIFSLVLYISFGFVITKESFINPFFAKKTTKLNFKPLKTNNITVTAPTLNDVCLNGGYKNLANIVITEGADTDFPNGTNNTLVLAMPDDFELEPNEGSITAQAGRNITGASIQSFINANKIIVIYSVSGVDKTDILTISGLKVRAKTSPAPDNQLVVESASPAIAGITAGTTVMATFNLNNLGKPVQVGSGLTFCASNLAGQTIRFNSPNADQLKWYRGAGLKLPINAATQNNNTNLNVTALVGNSPTPGTHTFYVTGKKSGDACESEETAVNILITAAPVVLLTKNVGNSVCINPPSQVSVTFTAIGSNASEYRFEMTRNGNAFNNQDFSPSNTYIFDFTITGDYSIIVIGKNGNCEVTSPPITLSVATKPSIAFKNTPISFTKSAVPAENIHSLRDYVDKAGGIFSSTNATVNAAIFDRDQINISSLIPNSYPLTYTYTDPSTGCSNAITGAGILGIVGDNVPGSGVITGIVVGGTYCENGEIGPEINITTPIFPFDSIRSDNFPNAIVKIANKYYFNPQLVTIPDGVSSVNVSLVMHYGIFIANPPPAPPIQIPGLAFPFTVTVTRKPIATIKPSGFCQGSITNFDAVYTALVNTPPNSPPPIYLWNFADPNDAEEWVTEPKTTTHTYTQPGSYEVKLIITNGQTSCRSDTIKQIVSIFPNFTISNNNLYIEDFESDDHGWREQGVKSTWGLGIPSVKRNIKASNRIWTTMPFDTQNQNIGGPDSSYANSQLSFVECPCLNIDGIDRPLLSMSIWSDTDISSDGASLQVTFDDGENWKNVGEVGNGLEWYNRKNILGLPSGAVNPDREGWTGKDLGWRKARFPLDEIKSLAIGKKIRFRVFFGSNADNPPDKYDGFAFDSVQIESRNRQSILEYFTSTNPADSVKNENIFVNAFPDPQDELTNIQYHTNFLGANPLNQDNTADPGARALYYGVSKSPRAAIDGFSNPNAKFSIWGPAKFRQKTLTPSPFEITVTFPANPANQLNIQADVTAVRDFNRPLIIHTVVVEKTIDKSNFTPPLAFNYVNVVKKMLPDAAGFFYNQPWTAGSSQTFTQSWTLYNLTQSNALNPKIYDVNQLAVVVFIQDDETKEIYQASTITTPSAAPPLVSGIEDPILKRFKMFPNPTQKELHFDFGQIMGAEYQWEIYNHWGARLMNGKFAENQPTTTCQVDNLAKGMYIVKVVNQKTKANVVKKLIIN